ncbi:T9SS type A sorting domain-containing protein, partial [bacterium]|nr:T9SS type A sorting domain-containing protein [bacterium]
HLGHCGNDWFLRMTHADIPSFDNDGTVHSLNFVYTQGCYGGSFDNRTSGGGYTSDCFSERFAGDDDGAVAIVSNTRYGWGEHNSTNGSSQYFDREFFDAMFGEGIYPLGYANNDSKVDVIWAITYGANRWCYYELTVFGDPAMELWTAEPIALAATHSPTVMVGQPDFEISIADGSRGAVEGAIVTIYTDDFSVYDTGATDAAGAVILHPSAASIGTLHVKATSHDHLVSNTTASIIPASGVYLALDSYIVDDDTVGDSDGNDDGEVGASETIEFIVTIGNFGTDMAYGVTATLSSSSSRIDIRDGYEEFGDIAGSGTATSPDGFVFFVDSDTPDGEVIPLTLTMSDAGSRETWESYVNIIVHAPVIDAQGYVVDDPPSGGNGNGCFEAGETIEITVTLENTGSVMSTGITGTLTTTDPNATVVGGAATIVFLNPDSSGVLSPSFTVLLSPVTPQGHEVAFDLAIEADWGYSSSAQMSLVTNGDFVDDIESGEGEWTHDNITTGFGDQWHVETYRSHSTTHSWKFGGSGSGTYGDSSDGVLVSKPLCLGADGEMTFWHWMAVEEESSTSAWDCGLVEISIDDGASWDILHPVGGYSHAKNDNNANPLPEGTPCWSGSFTWRQETFDLTSYEDAKVQIRFHFASDGYVTLEGWYVDDISITSTLPQTSVPESEEIPRTFALRQNAPNPFNPVTVIQYQLPRETHVTIDVFSIAGKLVATLVDEEQDAGVKAVTWDGTSATGEKVASGIYMYRMQAGDHTSRKMMVLLK